MQCLRPANVCAAVDKCLLTEDEAAASCDLEDPIFGRKESGSEEGSDSDDDNA